MISATLQWQVSMTCFGDFVPDWLSCFHRIWLTVKCSDSCREVTVVPDEGLMFLPWSNRFSEFFSQLQKYPVGLDLPASTWTLRIKKFLQTRFKSKNWMCLGTTQFQVTRQTFSCAHFSNDFAKKTLTRNLRWAAAAVWWIETRPTNWHGSSNATEVEPHSVEICRDADTFAKRFLWGCLENGSCVRWTKKPPMS